MQRQFLLLTLAVPALACAQQAKPFRFDVASIKPATLPDGVSVEGTMIMARKGATIPQRFGGPGTSNPGRIHYPLVSLKDLLGRAYDGYFDIVGPSWLNTQIMQVDATMPPETTKEQFREMLRNLMEERFGVKYHAEEREIAGYALEVAKGGPKLKETAGDSAPENPGGGDPIARSGGRGADGFPLQSPIARGSRGISYFSTAQGRRRIYVRQQTMREFVTGLSLQFQQDLGGPTGPRVFVADATGLSGKYDFELTYAHEGTPDAETLPSVFSALQAQLGLKLQPRKVPVSVMVIDHMDREPSAN